MRNSFNNIAVLLTCHNRKEKTREAISSLLAAREKFVKDSSCSLSLSFFVTDDGCIDGTKQMLMHDFPNESIEIVHADGNAYWAGGMRLSWKRALECNREWNFFLLINDDVVFFDNVFHDLFKTHKYCVYKYGIGGVYSGFVSDKNNPTKILYGAKEYKSFLSHIYDILPNNVPQECSMTNANILLVCKNVVDSIGILDDEYIHGGADWDYGMRANKAHLPVLTTYGVCGFSENDHDTNREERNRVVMMKLAERKSFLNRPNREYHDAFVFFKRYNLMRYVILKGAYSLNLFFPRLFYFLNELRP